MTLFLFISLISFSGLIAAAETKLGLNDVSYMWRPPLTKPEAAKLISLNQVIPETVFQEIMSFASGETYQNTTLKMKSTIPIPVLVSQNWRIVSMRIDPCAPGTPNVAGNLSQCIQELRLVAQPFDFIDEVIEYHDFSMHVIFEINKGDPVSSIDFKDLWNDLNHLKKNVSTTGLPLSIHPGFKTKGFQDKLSHILMQHLKRFDLHKITYIGAAQADGPWVFFQGTVNNGRYVLEPDPTLQNQAHGLASPEPLGKGGHFEPRPTNSFLNGSGPSIVELFTNEIFDWDKPVHIENQEPIPNYKMKDLVHIFNNPKITNRTNSDCFSCHLVMSRGQNDGIAKEDNPFKYRSINRNLNLKPTFLSPSHLNFRVFGWFGSRPTIAERVINESASVVEMMEKLFPE